LPRISTISIKSKRKATSHSDISHNFLITKPDLKFMKLSGLLYKMTRKWRFSSDALFISSWRDDWIC